MRPRFKRDLDACQPSDMFCPRPSRVDDDRRVETSLCGIHADDFSAGCSDSCHFAVLDQRRVVALCGFEEGVGGERRVGVA